MPILDVLNLSSIELNLWIAVFDIETNGNSYYESSKDKERLKAYLGGSENTKKRGKGEILPLSGKII